MTTVKHAMLVSVDGLRGDAVAQVDTPNIDALAARGAYTFEAQACMPSITLPCHVSMIFGATPQRHGTVTNVFQPANPPLPGLIDMVHEAGMRTAAFYTWGELRDLSRPYNIDMFYYHLIDREGANMLEIAKVAAGWLAQRNPGFTFVYLEAPDAFGHDHGWMSERYFHSVALVDKALGILVNALQAAGGLDDTLIVLTSDHGGHSIHHGSPMPEDMIVPWIVAGPGVRRNHRLAEPVCIIDTAPTIVQRMGLAVPPEWEGRAVTEALLPGE